MIKWYVVCNCDKMEKKICSNKGDFIRMKLILKNDNTTFLPPEQICTFEHNGRKIHCNVDLMIEDYNGKRAEAINVSEIYKEDSTVNFEYAITTNNKNPIIIVRFSDGTYEILDGNHRLYKAVYEGKHQVMAYILNEIELEKYIMH